jgi:hypothetical protein
LKLLCCVNSVRKTKKAKFMEVVVWLRVEKREGSEREKG